MSYDEIQRLTEIERITNEKPRYLDMDEAFCARMHAAIAAGLAPEWKGLPPAPTREPPVEPPVKNLQHNLEKLTRRLEAELRGSPPFRRQRTEDLGRDPIEEAVPDDIVERSGALIGNAALRNCRGVIRSKTP